MLGKLLKHEFIATRRTLPLVYLAAVASTALLILSIFMKNNIIIGLLAVVAVVLFSSVAVVTLVVIISQFARGFYGGEGYLTHTLPATETQHLSAKLISALCWLVISTLVLIGLGLILFFSAAAINGQPIAPLSLEAFYNAIGITPTVFWLTIVPMVLLNLLVHTAGSLIMLYFSIALANIQPFSKHPVVASVGFVYGISFAMQILSIPLMRFIPDIAFFGPEFAIFGPDQWMPTLMQFSNWALAINAVVYVGLFIGTVQLMKHKLSLK